MPENEEGDSKQPKEAAGGGGMLAGTKGWAIVVGAVLLEAVFFLVLMHLQAGQTVKGQGAAEEKIAKESLDDRTGNVVSIENLNYSIPTQGGTTATLSMSLTIVLGRTAEERQREVVITAKDWTTFKDAVAKMEPYIRDRLIQYVGQQTYNQLNSPSGKEKIKDMIKQFVNSELSRLDLTLDNKDLARQRVSDVLMPSFYLQ